MRLSGVAARAAVSVLLALCMGLPPAPAFEAPRAPGATGRSGPPFTIGGFEYTLMPQGIHMNICNQRSCGPGSKVSYILFGPRPQLTFQAYKAQRAEIAAQFKKVAPAGVTFTFKPPTQQRTKLFTFLESHRITKAADGQKEVTISRTILTKNMSIDLISTARDEKLANANLAPFTLAALVVADVGGQAKR